jgi:hypothetical protein
MLGLMPGLEFPKQQRPLEEELCRRDDEQEAVVGASGGPAMNKFTALRAKNSAGSTAVSNQRFDRRHPPSLTE